MFVTLKKLTSILLALLIISQTFVNVGIGIYYHLNKVYITQKLCENKSNPALHCNGHCYLSKQLKKAEEGERKQAQNILKEKEEIVSRKNETIPGKYFPAFVAYNFADYNCNPPVSDFRNTLVKPPAL